MGTSEVRREPLPGSINDIFKTEVDGLLPPRILLLGPAGHGKTTAVAKMVYDWAHGVDDSPLKDIPLVFAVMFRRTDKGTSLGKAILSQLLGNMKGVTPEDIEKFLGENNKECLILLDGYDEFSGTMIPSDKSSSCNQSSIIRALRYEELRNIRVLVTSRPYRGEDFDSEEAIARVYVKMEIEGFTGEDSQAYIERFFGSSPEKSQAMSAYLEEQGVIGALVNIPFFCMTFCNLWEADLLKDTQTLTGVFNKMLKYLLQHFRRREGEAGRKWLDKISPEEMKSVIYTIGKISLQGLLGDGKKILFTESDFKECMKELEFGVNLGLLLKQTTTQESDEWYELSKTYIEFYHKLAQEHCTGIYISSLSLQEIEDNLCQLNSEGKIMDFENVLRFTVGTLNDSCSAILRLLRCVTWKQEGKKASHKHRVLLDVLAESSRCDQEITQELECQFAECSLDITKTSASTISGFGKLPAEIRSMVIMIVSNFNTSDSMIQLASFVTPVYRGQFSIIKQDTLEDKINFKEIYNACKYDQQTKFKDASYYININLVL